MTPPPTPTASPAPGFAPRAGRVLVTGATGFLGGALARALHARGRAVTATGRDARAGAALEAEGIPFARLDLGDADAVHRLVEGHAAVIHSAALAAPYGRAADFWRANVQATAHVLGACQAAGVQRLVHLSTPSVYFGFESREDVRESDELPALPRTPYAASKRLADVLVRAAVAEGLSAILLRPRAIYGPGDRAVLPRLIRALRTGRLPIIGDGHNRVSMTYIDHAVDAAIRALDAPDALSGRIYNVADGEPVALWAMIAALCDRLGLPRPTRHVSLARMMRVGGVLEAGVPPPAPGPRARADALQRGRGGLLADARHHRAPPRPRLPPVGDAGRGASALCRVVAGAGGDAVSGWRLAWLEAGACRAPERLSRGDGRWRTHRFPAGVGLLEGHGRIVLFDTGYAPRYRPVMQCTLPHRLLTRALAPVVTPSAADLLAARGIAPEAVTDVFVSHFHTDHVGGLRDFPHARFHAHPEALRPVRAPHGVDERGGLRRRLPAGRLRRALHAPPAPRGAPARARPVRRGLPRVRRRAPRSRSTSPATRRARWASTWRRTRARGFSPPTPPGTSTRSWTIRAAPSALGMRLQHDARAYRATQHALRTVIARHPGLTVAVSHDAPRRFGP